MEDPKRGITKDSTLRLRAVIATAYHKTIIFGISLANLLEEKHCPINLNHSSFDAIRNVLHTLFP